MEKHESSFFDRNTLIAIVLVGVVWFAWQSYLTNKYPGYGKPPEKTEVKRDETAPAPVAETEVKPTDLAPQAFGKNAEKLLPVENDVMSLQISSRGMALKEVTLKKFKNRDNQLVTVGSSEGAGLFELRLNGQPVDFEVQQQTNEHGQQIFTGFSKQGPMLIKRTLVVGNTYFIQSQVGVENPPKEFKGFQVVIPEKKRESDSGSIFAPSMEIQEFVYGSDNKFERVITESNEPIEKNAGFLDVSGITSHYFAAIFANESEIKPEIFIKSRPDAKEVSVLATFSPTNPQPAMSFPATLFVGPKDFQVLQSAEAGRQNLTHMVNFGFFEVIGKMLLKVLRFFYENTIPNWGLAIIFLTLLVRLLVLPFNIASYKSMKKMQKIQPMIQSLRERYKDDATTMNTEMMKLMKEQKVNPLGGCLPMLLQMPVFFALYQVLSQSIELYQAPFFGWIQDLSLKDPYFILPILMAVAMWYNQKITPTTMDPTQAKIMQFLPILFGFMMVALPSGLTLYMFVSTLFGIIQQQIFMKDRSLTQKPTKPTAKPTMKTV